MMKSHLKNMVISYFVQKCFNNFKNFSDVNGKCLHLVQRPPPSTSGSGTSTNDSTTDSRRSRYHSNIPDFDNLVMGSFSIPVPVSVPMSGNIVGPPHTTTSLNPSSTLCGNRITVGKYPKSFLVTFSNKNLSLFSSSYASMC